MKINSKSTGDFFVIKFEKKQNFKILKNQTNERHTDDYFFVFNVNRNIIIVEQAY